MLIRNLFLFTILFSCFSLMSCQKVEWIKRSESIQNVKYSVLPDDQLLLANFDAPSITRKMANADFYNGGDSHATISYDTNAKNGRFLHFKYFLGPKVWWRYANVELVFPAPIDARKYTHLRFKVKGSEYPMRVKLIMFNFEGFDYHGFTLPPTPKDWQETSISFTDLKQEGWGARQKLQLSSIRAIQFQTASARSGETGWFEIDDVYFVNADK